jgi:pyruvate/2-oxoglutarate dehydrogenase complex dihydrolipoamide acyltransferase (E2) component
VKEFRLPDLGEGVTEGQVVRLLVGEGQAVVEDQPLMEVETDKAAVEIPSPHAGTVTTVHVRQGQVVNVGDVMLTFDGNDTPERAATVGSAPRAAVPPPMASPAAGPRKPASPAVRKLARSMGIDIETIDGSGPGGRVIHADIERAALRTTAVRAAGPSPATRAPVPAPPPPAPAHTPAAAPPSPVARLQPVEPPGVDDRDQWGPVRREPLSRTRKTIAERMCLSAKTIPHVTDTDDADITELDQFRRGHADPRQPTRKLTILPFVVRALARALARFPQFNAVYDEPAEEIVYRRYVGISVGVHTDRGLIAPVLRHPDALSIPQIADELAALVDKARTARFEVNDTRGGTFTISNAGAMGGSRYSTPIINHPQSAILALGRSRWQPWVVAGEVVPRLILPLSLSFDHRLIDGGAEVGFMQQIIGDLENPARMVL